jgi:hypothetical protein
MEKHYGGINSTNSSNRKPVCIVQGKITVSKWVESVADSDRDKQILQFFKSD